MGHFRRQARATRREANPLPDEGGATSQWCEEYFPICARLAERGLTDAEIAKVLGVNVDTLVMWRWTKPELDEVMIKWRAHADDRVERALYEKAVGYSYPVEKILVIQGKVERVQTIEHVPPSDQACLYWLENRRPDVWRRVQDKGLQLGTLADYDKMTDDELRKIAALGREEITEPHGRPN